MGSTSAISSSTASSTPAAAGPRERFEAVRSLRARRPVPAMGTHGASLRAREPEAGLLPVDGVPDRPLARQQRHEPAARSARDAGRRAASTSTGSACSSRSPTPASATAASGGSRPASSTRWRRCSCRPWATGCATSTACSGSRSRTAGSASGPTTGSVARTRGRSPARTNGSRSRSTARSRCVAARLRAVPGRPSTLIGMPFDRPVVGYGGKTINTLRLWAAAAPDSFDFQEFSQGDFVGALAETLEAESLTRVLYPDDSTTSGQGLRFVQEYFLVACSLADLVRRFRRSNADWSALPDQVAIQLNDTHPTHGGPGADAHPARRGAARLGPGVGAHAADAGLHQPHAAARSAREVAARLVRDPAPASPGDHPRDQPAPPRRRTDPLPGRRGARRAREPRRGRSRAEDPDGEPGDRRLAQHQRRRGDPLRAAADDDGQGPGRDVPRALQQQDERRDAATLAAACEPGARAHASRRPSATAG